MGGFLGPAGALANIIGFGAPVAQTTGNLIQNQQNVSQRNANDQAFMKMVNGMGPEYQWAQNWLKQAGPGAIPDVAAALGGPKQVGELIARQQELEALKPYLDDPKLSPDQLARKVYEVTGDPTLLEDLWKSEFRMSMSSKEPPLTNDQIVKTLLAGIGTAPKEIRGFLQAAIDAAKSDPEGSRGLLLEGYKLLYPALNASYAQQLVPQFLYGHDAAGNPVVGPYSFPKASNAPGTPRGFVAPGETAPSTGVSVPPPPAAAPSPGEEGAPGAAATPAPSVGERMSSALGALGSAISGAGAEPGAISATPGGAETPEEAMTPTAAPSEEEATPLASPTAAGLPSRVPTAVPSPTELAMGAPTPSPDTSEPGIPVSVGGAGTPTPLPTAGIGEPSGPLTKTPQIKLPRTPPTPAVIYGVSKPDNKTLNIGQTSQRAYVSLLGFRNAFQQFTPEEWDRSATIRWLDYNKRKHVGIDTGDPRLDAMIGKAITVEKQTQSAMAASMGTNSYKAQQDAHGHLPRAGDSYAIIKSDLDNLLAPDGPYVSAMQDANIPIPGGMPTPYVLPPPAGMATPRAGDRGRRRDTGEDVQWSPN